MDDVGVDKIAAYDLHPEPAYTPTIDRLAAAGIRFTQGYANPTCTPTRASLLTGRHGRATGMGRWIYHESAGWGLADEEVTLPEMLALSEHSYASALAGKWHVQTSETEAQARDPLNQGFDHHAGSFSNLTASFTEPSQDLSYTYWEKLTDGEAAWTETYATTDSANEAIRFMDELPEPWFIYLAFNAPHDPIHAPPDELLNEPLRDYPTMLERYHAMLEALDTELGRVLDAMPGDVAARTTVMVLGDNGTPSWGVAEPWDPLHYKGSIWEAGVRVPWIVTGPFVPDPGGTRDHLVHATDIFATAAHMAGVSPRDIRWDRRTWPTLAGESLLPILWSPDDVDGRTHLVTGGFFPNGPGAKEWEKDMIRTDSHKLMRLVDDGVETELFFEVGPDLVIEDTELLSSEEPLTDHEEDVLLELRALLAAYTDGVTVGP